MVTLVLAEKPSVARELARILGVAGRHNGAFMGRGLWVSWCIGHVAELCEPDHYDPAWRVWRAKDLPMLPKTFALRPSAHAIDHWHLLKKLLGHNDVTEWVNACDAGREGELIFRFATELSGCRRPTTRLWLNALTDAAVHDAWRKRRKQHDYDALADAARCRAEADWLVGLNATRALTLSRRKSGKGPLLTVGRVQTPTLAMLTERERDIEAFVAEPFWQVLATVQDDQKTTPPFAATVQNGNKDRFDRRDEAERAKALLSKNDLVVHRLEERQERDLPPLLFDLTSLQRVANARFNLSAQQTLDVVQALYERHKAVTYPRTDSSYLPKTLAPALPSLLLRMREGPDSALIDPILTPSYQGPAMGLQRMINDHEVGDHHAIVPTGKMPHVGALSHNEARIFAVICRRFIAAFYPAAKLSHVRLLLRCGPLHLLTRGKTIVDEGYYKVEPRPVPRASGANVDAAHLPRLRVGQMLTQLKTDVKEGHTQPPPRLSEAAILGAMERAGRGLEQAELRLALKDAGLGTPATRAAIIENLKRRQLVVTEGRVLKATLKGMDLIATLPVAALKSPELTGKWEAKLTAVAKGELKRAVFMQEINRFVTEMVRTIFATPPKGSGPEPALPQAPSPKSAPKRRLVPTARDSVRVGPAKKRGMQAKTKQTSQAQATTLQAKPHKRPDARKDSHHTSSAKSPTDI